MHSPLDADEESTSDLGSPLALHALDEESTSDLGVSIESLCISEDSVVGVSSGQHKEAWQPELEVGKEECKPKGSRKKTLHKSASACCLGSHKTVSSKRKKSARSHSTRKKI